MYELMARPGSGSVQGEGVMIARRCRERRAIIKNN